jgi:hypothetical protein
MRRRLRRNPLDALRESTTSCLPVGGRNAIGRTSRDLQTRLVRSHAICVLAPVAHESVAVRR